MNKNRKTISAYVITIGEPTLNACLHHLKKQTRKLDVIDVVENMPGYANARNEVHRRVETDYFLPVDADMLLHPRCVDLLFSRTEKREKVFDVVGRLHDPLLGSIMGIHLLRTEYVKHVIYEDTIVGDATFMDGLSEKFEKIILNHVVGLHRPDYGNPVQLYHKFTLEGEKIRAKANAARFEKDMQTLRAAVRRGNRSAEIAMIFLCQGLFAQNVSSYNYLEYNNASAQEALRIIADVLKLQPSCDDTWREKLFHRYYYEYYAFQDFWQKVSRKLRRFESNTTRARAVDIISRVPDVSQVNREAA